MQDLRPFCSGGVTLQLQYLTGHCLNDTSLFGGSGRLYTSKRTAYAHETTCSENNGYPGYFSKWWMALVEMPVWIYRKQQVVKKRKRLFSTFNPNQSTCLKLTTFNVHQIPSHIAMDFDPWPWSSDEKTRASGFWMLYVGCKKKFHPRNLI